MNSADLTPEQLQQVEARVLPILRFQNRLGARMDKLGFPVDEPLRAAARRAWQDVYALRVAVHYARCEADKRRRLEQEREGK